MTAQPYQKASEEIQRQQKLPGEVLKNVASAGATIAGGGAILGRIAPFLNRMIPADLAIKGLTKINPQLGKFIGGAMAAGYTAENALDIVREKTGEEEPETSSPLDEAEQVAPGLIGYIKEAIKNGMSPENALFIAGGPQNKERYKEEINRLEGASGMAFTDYLMSLLTGKKPESKAALQPPQAAQQAPPPATQGGGQQALMEALQKLQQIRGK